MKQKISVRIFLKMPAADPHTEFFVQYINLAASGNSFILTDLLSQPCCVLKCLQKVFPFKVWVIGENLIYAVPSADLSNDHTDSDPHSTDARFASHYVRLLRNTIHLLHAVLPTVMLTVQVHWCTDVCAGVAGNLVVLTVSDKLDKGNQQAHKN